jgi:hypothetical protein
VPRSRRQEAWAGANRSGSGGVRPVCAVPGGVARGQWCQAKNPGAGCPVLEQEEKALCEIRRGWAQGRGCVAATLAHRPGAVGRRAGWSSPDGSGSPGERRRPGIGQVRGTGPECMCEAVNEAAGLGAESLGWRERWCPAQACPSSKGTEGTECQGAGKRRPAVNGLASRHLSRRGRAPVEGVEHGPKSGAGVGAGAEAEAVGAGGYCASRRGVSAGASDWNGILVSHRNSGHICQRPHHLCTASIHRPPRIVTTTNATLEAGRARD